MQIYAAVEGGAQGLRLRWKDSAERLSVIEHHRRRRQAQGRGTQICGKRLHRTVLGQKEQSRLLRNCLLLKKPTLGLLGQGGPLPNLRAGPAQRLSEKKQPLLPWQKFCKNHSRAGQPIGQVQDSQLHAGEEGQAGVAEELQDTTAVSG